MRQESTGKPDPERARATAAAEPGQKRGFFAAAGARLKRVMTGRAETPTPAPVLAAEDAEADGEVSTSVQARARELLSQDRAHGTGRMRASVDAAPTSTDGEEPRKTTPPPLPSPRTAAADDVESSAEQPSTGVTAIPPQRAMRAAAKRPVRDSKSDALRARLGAAKAALAEAQAKRAAETEAAAPSELGTDSSSDQLGMEPAPQLTAASAAEAAAAPLSPVVDIVSSDDTTSSPSVSPASPQPSAASASQPSAASASQPSAASASQPSAASASQPSAASASQPSAASASQPSAASASQPSAAWASQPSAASASQPSAASASQPSAAGGLPLVAAATAPELAGVGGEEVQDLDGKPAPEITIEDADLVELQLEAADELDESELADVVVPAAASGDAPTTKSDAGAGAGKAQPPALKPRARKPPKSAEPGEEAAGGTETGVEPIRTRTIARLLARQGYFDRSLSIYDELLRRNPADRGLRIEADKVRTKKRKKADG